MSDSHNLKRFVDAQNAVFDQALAELKAGRKQGHWMWFVFPQLKGLGHSAMAEKYGIASSEEAAAYLAHPTLGPRLRECTAAVNDVQDNPIDDILGYPDNLKFHSSMTLFSLIEPTDEVFKTALKKYFRGDLDKNTKSRL